MKFENLKSRLIFWLALSFLLVFSGFSLATVVFMKKLPPYETVRQTYKWVESYWRHGRMAPSSQLVNRPKRASNEQFSVTNPTKVTDGYYAVLLWDETELEYKTKLFAPDGEVMHSWSIDYSDLLGGKPGKDPKSPHGFLILPDGSIIVNFDRGEALIKLDSCSQEIWVTKGHYHHSLELAEDGSVWTWRGLKGAYDQYQYIVNFDPANGDIIRQIDFIEDVVRNPANTFWEFVLGADYKFQSSDHNPGSRKDVFHPNDVEALSSELSAEYASFDPGDLLISLKEQSLVAVIDPVTLIVKWWRQGPWRLQHDPDFQPDGTISVFNNNSKRWHSEIIRINPDTGELFNELSRGDIRFYTSAQGKHQFLPGGNVLIVVPGEGRLLIASPTGEKILEFNNLAPGQKQKNGRILNAQWVPKNFFGKIPSCAAQPG